MRRLNTCALATATLLFFGLAWPASDAVGQGLKQKFIGTWTIVSAETTRSDGSKAPTFGANPKGILVFDGHGRYALQIVRAALPKFASNNRMEGTAEENKAIVQGMITHFGRYSVNEADRTFTYHVETSSFPNWVGSEQRRPFTFTGDQLKYTAAAASGGGSAEVVWKRVK